MRTAAQRIAKYEARMVSTLLDPVLSAVNVQQKANFGIYATEWVPLQEAVHTYLTGQPIYPSEYFNYNAFAGEIYHVSKRFAGQAAINAGSDLVLKYLTMGCTGVHLRAIAANVFNIIIP